MFVQKRTKSNVYQAYISNSNKIVLLVQPIKASAPLKSDHVKWC